VLSSSGYKRRTFYLEDGDSMFFQTNGKLLPDYTVTSKKTVIFSFTFLSTEGNNILIALNVILPILLPLELLID
jgi:hypothetical protein